MKNKKGYISFIALILSIISSLFVFYFISLNNTYSYSKHLQKSLDKSTKSIAAALSLEKKEENINVFEKILNLNLKTGNKICLEEIESNHNYEYYKYDGYEDNENIWSIFKKTPKVVCFVFDGNNIENIKESVENNFLYNNEIEFNNEERETIYEEIRKKTNDFDTTNNNPIVVSFSKASLYVFSKEFEVCRFSVKQFWVKNHNRDVREFK